MTEEFARRQALAMDYWNIRRKQIEKGKETLTRAQKNFLFTPEDQNVRIHAAFASAMKDPATVPSAYIAEHLDWLFDEAIPRRDREMILYFADRLREYPYWDSWGKRSFRSRTNGDYIEK